MRVQGTAEMGHEIARRNVDQAVIQLWLALRDLSDFDDEYMREDDLDLWGKVTAHRAIQNAFNRSA
jgi:hypothetical protein